MRVLADERDGGAVRTVASGESMLDPEAASRVMRRMRDQAERTDPLSALTPQERRILNYKVHDGSIVFRTAEYSPTGEDLRTGMPPAEYEVAFEVDAVDTAAREGWSVLLHGPAHHMDLLPEQALALETGVEPWPAGERDHAIRITPTRITGRRIRRTGN